MWELKFRDISENGDLIVCADVFNEEQTGWRACAKTKEDCTGALINMIEKDAPRRNPEDVCGAVVEIAKWIMIQLKN